MLKFNHVVFSVIHVMSELKSILFESSNTYQLTHTPVSVAGFHLNSTSVGKSDIVFQFSGLINVGTIGA